MKRLLLALTALVLVTGSAAPVLAQPSPNCYATPSADGCAAWASIHARAVNDPPVNGYVPSLTGGGNVGYNTAVPVDTD